MNATKSEQMVGIFFTHDELENMLEGLEEGMSVVNQLQGIIGGEISDELRIFHMRVKWAHKLVCSAYPEPGEVFAQMPSSVMERITLNV